MEKTKPSDDEDGNGNANDIVPVPDPTIRTEARLRREVSLSQQITDGNIDLVRQVIDTRLAGMDRAIELLQKATDRFPEHVKHEVLRLQELHSEKFSSIEKQFIERDKRTEQISSADKTAIAAALQAQEKQAIAQNETNATANGKTEFNFSKLIEETKTLMRADMASYNERINSLGSRLDRGEGHGKGISDIWGYAIGLIGALVAIGTLLAVVLRQS